MERISEKRRGGGAQVTNARRWLSTDLSTASKSEVRFCITVGVTAMRLFFAQRSKQTWQYSSVEVNQAMDLKRIGFSFLSSCRADARRAIIVVGFTNANDGDNRLRRQRG